jgi:hypothetical protein
MKSAQGLESTAINSKNTGLLRGFRRHARLSANLPAPLWPRTGCNSRHSLAPAPHPGPCMVWFLKNALPICADHYPGNPALWWNIHPHESANFRYFSGEDSPLESFLSLDVRSASAVVQSIPARIYPFIDPARESC